MYPAARLAQAPRTRRGAWYRVLSAGKTRVVLDVFGNRVDLPMGAVEVRRGPPEKFTVVYLPPGEQLPPRGQGGELGRTYAVCPKCAARIRLYGEPKETVCPTCAHVGVIAWWETG